MALCRCMSSPSFEPINHRTRPRLVAADARGPFCFALNTEILRPSFWRSFYLSRLARGAALPATQRRHCANPRNRASRTSEESPAGPPVRHVSGGRSGGGPQVADSAAAERAECSLPSPKGVPLRDPSHSRAARSAPRRRRRRRRRGPTGPRRRVSSRAPAGPVLPHRSSETLMALSCAGLGHAGLPATAGSSGPGLMPPVRGVHRGGGSARAAEGVRRRATRGACLTGRRSPWAGRPEARTVIPCRDRITAHHHGGVMGSRRHGTSGFTAARDHGGAGSRRHGITAARDHGASSRRRDPVRRRARLPRRAPRPGRPPGGARWARGVAPRSL
jgi:hypothetical protein